ncbi:head maturation protease, ClpP-related [Streptococcus ferus]|uniref:head maturation protease, ClpP-related n=1 Tax=Streptococcus ferus TaxID=1345 RepID=UPI003514FD70
MGKIEVKGDIVSNDTGEFYDFFGMTSTYPKKVQQAIENDEDDDLIIDVASNGGDVFAASEIYTMIKSSGKRITVNIQGLAASAASVISMAGDEVRISPTAMIMIHKASVIGEGNADDFEHQSDVLNSIDESIASAYELKTGMNQDELLELMAKETWLNAKEAVSKGFADEIMFANDEDGAEEPLDYVASFSSLPSRQAINKFRNLIATEKIKNAQEPKESLVAQKLKVLKKGEKF